MNAVVASGISSMSDSWISWKPRIEEPSNPSPLSKSSASSAASGRLMCCQVPGRSTNLRSTISTPRSVANSMTSSADVAPRDRAHLRAVQLCHLLSLSGRDRSRAAGHLMNRISEYFGSGHRSSATTFSSWSAAARTAVHRRDHRVVHVLGVLEHVVVRLVLGEVRRLERLDRLGELVDQLGRLTRELRQLRRRAAPPR